MRADSRVNCLAGRIISRETVETVPGSLGAFVHPALKRGVNKFRIDGNAESIGSGSDGNAESIDSGPAETRVNGLGTRVYSCIYVSI